MDLDLEQVGLVISRFGSYLRLSPGTGTPRLSPIRALGTPAGLTSPTYCMPTPASHICINRPVCPDDIRFTAVLNHSDDRIMYILEPQHRTPFIHNVKCIH